jgi:dephospho-CoA kinase
LNKIIHPAIAAEMDRRMKEQRNTNNVVVLDIPLLAENPRKGLCGVIVVDVPVDLAVERLVQFRNMDEADARARIAKQATREERIKIADRVVDNSGDMNSLAVQVDEVWSWAQTLPPAAEDAGERTSEA